MTHTSQGYIGTGHTFSYNMVTIDLIASIGFIDVSCDELDYTHMTSTAKESLPGLPDPGHIVIKFFFDDLDSKHTGLLVLADAPVLDAFTVTLPVRAGASAASTYTGFGYISGYKEDDVTPGELCSATVTFKISGATTFSAGS